MEIDTAIIIFIVGFCSSYIGSIAGAGGASISIPALILLGVPTTVAIATKRFSHLGSDVVAIFQYHHSKKIAWSHGLIISVFTAIATIIGSTILVNFDKNLLSKILGISIIITIPLTFTKKEYGLNPKKVSRQQHILGYIVYFFVDIADAFTGIIGGFGASLTLISLMGLTYLEANATKKIASLTMAIVGSIIFAHHGVIEYTWGIVLMLGTTIGGYLGVRTALRHGSYLVKIVFSVIVFLSAIKLMLF